MRFKSTHGVLPLCVVLRSPHLSTGKVSLRDMTLCSPLPSSSITRLHRYYWAVRLPVIHLPFFVSCQVYHYPTLLLSSSFSLDSRSLLRWYVETTGSPQLTQRPCATWLTLDPGVLRSVLPKRHPHIAFRHEHGVGAPVKLYFGVEMPSDPIALMSTLSPQRLRYVPKTLFRWLVGPYRAGFPPALRCALRWAHAHL